MPSSTTDHGFIKQAPGENENTWGDILNENVIELIDDGIFGRCNFALSGPKLLTNTAGVVSEARNAILHATSGTGGTITIPTLSKIYMAINDTSGDMEITAGGLSATLGPTERNIVVCDGTNVYPLGVSAMAWKAYVDATAFSMAAGELPGQAGNSGKFLKTVAEASGWYGITGADISGLVMADITDFAFATVAEVWAGNVTNKPVPPSVLKAAQAPQTVADASPLVIDLNAGINFVVQLTSAIGATRQLQFTNEKPGWAGAITFLQPASGGPCAVTKDTDIKIPGGSLSLSAGASAIDEAGYSCKSTYTVVTVARALS